MMGSEVRESDLNRSFRNDNNRRSNRVYTGSMVAVENCFADA